MKVGLSNRKNENRLAGKIRITGTVSTQGGRIYKLQGAAHRAVLALMWIERDAKSTGSSRWPSSQSSFPGLLRCPVSVLAVAWPRRGDCITAPELTEPAGPPFPMPLNLPFRGFSPVAKGSQTSRVVSGAMIHTTC